MAVPAMSLVAFVAVVPLLFLLRVSLLDAPLGKAFHESEGWTAKAYRELWANDSIRMTIWTFAFGLATATLSLLLGYALALFMTARTPRSRVLALSLVMLPKTVGTLAVLFGIQRLLPRGVAGALAAEVILILPFVVLVLYVRLRSIDPLLNQAAQGLGANAWQTWRRVTLPLSWPAIVRAFQLSLIWGIGAFLGPMFLGGPQETTLALEIHRQGFEYGRWSRAAAVAVILLSLTALASAAASLLLRRSR